LPRIRLADGRVLIAGGIEKNSSNGDSALRCAVVYDAAGD